MVGIVHRFYNRISEQLFTEQLHMAASGLHFFKSRFYKNNEAEIGCSYHVCSSLMFLSCHLRVSE